MTVIVLSIPGIVFIRFVTDDIKPMLRSLDQPISQFSEALTQLEESQKERFFLASSSSVYYSYSIKEEEMLTKTEQLAAVDRVLGYPGRMISGSKSAYSAKYGTHFTIFNSNVFVEGIGKVWYGDLDLTKDESKLSKLALTLRQKIHVLYEMDGRFENEDRSDKDLSKVSAYVTDGKTGDIGKKYQQYFYRDKKGRLLQKEG